MASCVVVEVLDVVLDCCGELEAGLPAFAVEELDLHATPERLDHCIVVWRADGSHRWCEAGVADLLAERPGRELGGFNRSSQRFAFGGIVDARRVSRLVCASQVSCVVCY